MLCRFVRPVGEVEVSLVEGGNSMAVTEDNKHDWLERLLRSGEQNTGRTHEII